MAPLTKEAQELLEFLWGQLKSTGKWPPKKPCILLCHERGLKLDEVARPYRAFAVSEEHVSASFEALVTLPEVQELFKPVPNVLRLAAKRFIENPTPSSAVLGRLPLSECIQFWPSEEDALLAASVMDRADFGPLRTGGSTGPHPRHRFFHLDVQRLRFENVRTLDEVLAIEAGRNRARIEDSPTGKHLELLRAVHQYAVQHDSWPPALEFAISHRHIGYIPELVDNLEGRFVQGQFSDSDFSRIKLRIKAVPSVDPSAEGRKLLVATAKAVTALWKKTPESNARWPLSLVAREMGVDPEHLMPWPLYLEYEPWGSGGTTGKPGTEWAFSAHERVLENETISSWEEYMAHWHTSPGEIFGLRDSGPAATVAPSPTLTESMPMAESEAPKFPHDAREFARAAEDMLRARNETAAVDALARGKVSLNCIDYDNWDGGTWLWEMVVAMPPRAFALLDATAVKSATEALTQACRELAGGLQGHSLSARIIPALPNPSTKAGLASDDPQTQLADLLAQRGLQLGAEVGSGTYGRVYAATHVSLGHARAVKVFAPSPLVQDSGRKLALALERFQREARVLSRLRHPAVVRLYDAHLEPPLCFIVTEFCEGVTAKTMVERGLVPIEAATTIVTTLLEALVEVHGAGVLHRDISHKNVIISDNSRLAPMLIDFGLSGFLEATLTERLTTTALGTAGFSAPELVSDPTCQDARIDVFSVAALLHYLVTGRPPNLAEPTRLLRGIGVGDQFITVAEKGFAVETARRFASAHDFLEALRGLAPSTVSAAPPTQLGAHTLDFKAVEDLLGCKNMPAVAELVETVRAALSREPPPRFKRDRTAHFATLLCGARQVVAIRQGRQDDWQNEDEIVQPLAQLVALTADDATADLDNARAVLSRAVEVGWLTEGQYDAWRPGMSSGSGLRSRYQVSLVGRKLLAEARIPVPGAAAASPLGSS